MKPKKILIALGDEEVSRNLTPLLKARGFNVISAPDAVSATSAAIRSQPDLIILDAALPGGGLEAAERMRLQPDLDGVPMILLGPDRRGTVVESSLMGGADALLSKPVDIAFLVGCAARMAGSTEAPPSDQEGSSRDVRTGQAPKETRPAGGGEQLCAEVTGLHGREAFLVLTEHQMRVSNRTRKGFVLVLLKVGNLKEIRDAHGALEAEHALVQAGRTLRESFRSSDIIAHVGGGEFAVLALETKSAGKDRLTRRLYSNLKHLNSEAARRYPVTLDAEIVCYDPLHPVPLGELLKDHDTALTREARA